MLRDRHARLDRQRVDDRAVELDRLVGRAVGADLAGEVQDRGPC